MAGADLFSGAAADRLAARAPAGRSAAPADARRHRGPAPPGGPGAPLRALIESDRLTSAILWGPPGTGKTTLARVVADATAKHFVPLSAVTAGVKDVREAIEAARRRWASRARGTILFVDEVHRFNKAQQDVLLPVGGGGLVVLIGATTENPFFEVNAPLLSRATLWRLEPLTTTTWPRWWVGAWRPRSRGRGRRRGRAGGLADGDARAALTTLEVAVALAGDRPGRRCDDVERAGHTRLSAPRRGRPLRPGQRAHQEHPRFGPRRRSLLAGPDARAGEDARFIARRLVILASEDVGMADPLALVVADAAARAVEFVGLPEAQLNLAQAVVHLACAPKSNRVTVALGRARQDVRAAPRGDVPAHLRDAHYRSASTIGHGEGYGYPHDDPGAWVDQEYRPADVAGQPCTTSRATGATRRWWPSASAPAARTARRRTPPATIGRPGPGRRRPDPDGSLTVTRVPGDPAPGWTDCTGDARCHAAPTGAPRVRAAAARPGGAGRPSLAAGGSGRRRHRPVRRPGRSASYSVSPCPAGATVLGPADASPV